MLTRDIPMQSQLSKNVVDCEISYFHFWNITLKSIMSKVKMFVYKTFIFYYRILSQMVKFAIKYVLLNIFCIRKCTNESRIGQ